MNLFGTFVRPKLEYSTQIWSPHYVCDINAVEVAQRRFTKYIPGMRHLSYPERLSKLGCDGLELRRMKFDLILVYKMLNI